MNESEWARLDEKVFTRLQATARAQEDAQRIAWQKAAEHSYSKGLEEGIPSFEAARKATRYFRKHGMLKEAQALENVVVGIYRPKHTDGQFGLCLRCAKRVLLSRRHDLYECPDNKNISNRFFKFATKQIAKHRESIDGVSCFWMRGSIGEYTRSTRMGEPRIRRSFESVALRFLGRHRR